MGNKNLILIMLVTMIWISGCGPPYDYREGSCISTTTDTFEGYTRTEIWAVGDLNLIKGLHGWDSRAKLTAVKDVYHNGMIRYVLQYYHPGKFIYPERLIFLIDGERHKFNFQDSKRDIGYGSLSDEWAWVSIEPSFLEKIANANTIQVRIVRSNGSMDYYFNERYHYCFKRFYEECVLPSQ